MTTHLISGLCIIYPPWCNKLERWSLSHGPLRPLAPRARNLVLICRNRQFNLTWNAVFVPICSKWAVISEHWAVRQTVKTNVGKTHTRTYTRTGFFLPHWLSLFLHKCVHRYEQLLANVNRHHGNRPKLCPGHATIITFICCASLILDLEEWIFCLPGNLRRHTLNLPTNLINFNMIFFLKQGNIMM